jgi:hypothetical protein
MTRTLKSRMLRVVLDVKCDAADANATIVAITRLRGVKHVVPLNDFDLDAPVEQLALTARPRNALLNAKITTLRELTAHSKYELKRHVRNLGKHGLDEIEARLKSLGLGLRPQTQGEFTANCVQENERNREASAKFLADFEETRNALRSLWLIAAQKGYVGQHWAAWRLVDIALRTYARRAAEKAGIYLYPERFPPSDPEPLVLPAAKA